MSRLWRGAVRLGVGLLVVAAATGPRGAAGQEGEPGDVRVGIRYEPGYLPGLAVRRVTARPPLERTASRVDSILRRDLDFSDRFEMLAVPDSVPTRESVNYGLWRDLGAVWILTADLSGSADRPLLRLLLYDVVYGRLDNVQAFPLSPVDAEGFRMAVHRAADAVVEWATGEPGIAATRVAFRRRARDGTSEIWIVDSDGHGARPLTRDSSIVYSPAFSPDGRRLAFASYVSGHPEIYELELATGERRRLLGRPGLNTTPTYDPRGGRMLVAQSDDGGGTEIYRYDLGPVCCRTRVTRTGSGDAVNPTYSPDGRRIAFTSSALGNPLVYVQEVDASSPYLVSEYVYGEGSYATSPDWSPTGDRIVYHARVDGVFQIFTVAPDGAGRKQLTSRGRNEDPSWAPDGRHVVFASDREGYRALWVLDTVTGRVRSLTVNHVDQLPAWSRRLRP